jgi:hypothetical protein
MGHLGVEIVNWEQFRSDHLGCGRSSDDSLYWKNLISWFVYMQIHCDSVDQKKHHLREILEEF